MTASVFLMLASLAATDPGGPAARQGKVERTGFDLHYRVYGQGEPVLVLSGGPGFDCDYMEQAMIVAYRPESCHDDVGQLLAADEMAPGMDLRPGLQKLQQPALVIAGRQDPMDPGMQYEIHLALRHSKLVLLDRCGHFAWMEQPEAFYGAIRDFLRADVPPHSGL